MEQLKGWNKFDSKIKIYKNNNYINLILIYL